MGFQTIFLTAALIWLASLAACLIAFFAKRFLTSLILCLSALAIGYLGLTHCQVNASKTVNGQLVWSLNSRWFFVATILLALLTLAYTIWKHRRANNGTSPA
jgi:heme/copper-type cytochrome/quinol oxidase subunit 2